MLPRLLIGFAIASTWLPTHALAQDVPVLSARARVRVWGDGLADEGLVARLFKVDGDTLHLFADSARPRALPIHSLRRFELSRGRNRWLTLGIPVLGAGAGAVIGPLLTTDELLCREEIAEPRVCAKETPDAVVGAAAGFILTAVLVNVFVKERWVGIPLDQLAILLDRQRFGVSVTVGLRR